MSENKHKNQADHIWHVWMNRYSEKEQKAGREWPHSLYEFKSLLHFLEYGWVLLQKAFTDALPKVHQQCSHSPVEAVPVNVLKCCLGTECTKCEILLSVKEAFDAERQRECGQLGKYYAEVPDEEMYRRMAGVCAWHIYREACGITEGFHGVDTSEGHLMDVTDRMFWDRVYGSMAATDPEEEAHP